MDLPRGDAMLLLTSAQADLQTTQTDRKFHADLAPVQFENDALRVLQAHGACAARNRRPGASGSIRARNVGRTPHAVGPPGQVRLRCADRCIDADTTDAQWMIDPTE